MAAKRTSRSKRKNDRQRAGRAKERGLPAKAFEERRSKPPPRDTQKKRRNEDEDERDSDSGDEAPARSKKAPRPPFSQNTIYIGAGVIVILAVVAYFLSRNSAQPQRAAPEPAEDTAPITLTMPPTPPGSGRVLQPPVLDEPPAGEVEEEKEAPPEKEKEEEKEKEKPPSAPTKPKPALGEPPKVSPKPTNAAPKPPAPPAPPKPAGDNPY